MDDNVKEVFNRIKATASVIGEAAGDVAKQAGKKVGESIESAKVSARVYETNKELSELFCQLGQIAYGAHIGEESSDEALDELMARIDAKTAELRDVQGKADERKKAMSCPVCGLSYAREDKFCKECGTPLI